MHQSPPNLFPDCETCTCTLALFEGILLRKWTCLFVCYILPCDESVNSVCNKFLGVCCFSKQARLCTFCRLSGMWPRKGLVSGASSLSVGNIPMAPTSAVWCQGTLMVMPKWICWSLGRQMGLRRLVLSVCAFTGETVSATFWVSKYFTLATLN